MGNRADSVRVAYPLFQAEGDGATPISALSLHVSEIPMRTAQELNRRWHSVLPQTHIVNLKGSTRSVAFGAECGGVYYAVAIWTHPIAANRMKDAAGAIELRRFAIAPDAPKNTASRMLAVMERLLLRKWPDTRRLLSYQSTEHHRGTIYKAAGWTPTRVHKFVPWSDRDDSTRAPAQVTSDKIRWEKQLTPATSGGE